MKPQRDKIKIIRKDALALRKMRIYRRITREDAGKAVGISIKSMERFENGRCTFTEKRKHQLLRKYRFSIKEYNDILNDITTLPDLPARSIYYPKIKKKTLRRKYKKIITKEIKVIRAMRKICGLSQSQAAKLCGYHRSVIDHIESGRIHLTQDRIKHMVSSYSKTMDDFDFLMEQKVLRSEVIEECQTIINRLDTNKLQAVQALLHNI